jgi:hypothetical protein
MLLIERVVKLLDDFHFGVFREHVKNLSVRSYYPLALLDVIDRSFEKEQESEKLFKAVYGDGPDGEKDMKKFFQLAHHTFKMTGFLARNYPDYLQHNITRLQHLVNTGQLDAATRLAEMLLDVSGKIEDFDTEMKVLRFLAQREALVESNKEALAYYERIGELLQNKRALNDISFFVYKQLKDKGKENAANVPEMLGFLQPYRESKSQVIQLMAKLNASYLRFVNRDDSFYKEENFRELESIQEALEKSDYIIFPHLHNIRPKLAFLKLNYSIRQLGTDKVLDEATALIEQSEEDLFWNSFINLPEINSIAIQTSHLVTNYFTTYRDDHLDILPDETKTRIRFLKNKSKSLLENKMLQENYVVRYINLTTIYSGLLLLGGKDDIAESYELLENLLLFYQQVPFHAYIDPIYLNMVLAGFCLKDFEKVERSYRRYKKSTTGKVVNPENDLVLNGFYYASKWLETNRDQYVKKIAAVIEQTTGKSNLSSTRKLLTDVIQYFKIPVSFVTLENN